ncbi:MAG: zinc ribbon domain-containing protein [Chloroflexi bacterium]|nr:zinc ribbon domain-containing protein [Chloroflexota bacterium]
MTIDPITLYYLTWLGWALAALLILSLWLSLIIWTYRDIASRTRHIFVRILAALWVALLFLPGLLIYLILRPTHTIEEDYRRALEEEALLHSYPPETLCPGCKRRVEQNWLVCPACGTEMKRNCSRCGKLLEVSWKVCPYCAAPSGVQQGLTPVSEEAASDPAQSNVMER